VRDPPSNQANCYSCLSILDALGQPIQSAYVQLLNHIGGGYERDILYPASKRFPSHGLHSTAGRNRNRNGA
jgi:hypothetical protein